MNLAKVDADRFFSLMRLLQVFVNKRLGLIPSIRSVKDYQWAEPEQRMLIRNALWENAHLIDDYVRLNPDSLNKEDLKIVCGWMQFKQGDFFLERVLKSYAVFIGGNDVYGVLGLYDSIDTLIPRNILPVTLQAVLLPFKGAIIYDGLLSSYPILFGGGYKASLKELYLKAKREGKIIVSFDPETQAASEAKMKKTFKDWQPVVNGLVEEAKSLRAEPGSPPAWGASFNLVKASLALTQAVLNESDDMDNLWKQFKRIERAMDKLEDAFFRSY